MEDRATSHGLWAVTAPPPPDLNPLEGEHAADVAVIGGGYTGLSAALHLAQAGKQVILLEARDIGYGGAGRNAGLVNAGLWLMPEDVLKIAGKPYGERLLAVLGASPDLVFDLIEKHAIECEAQHNGTLHCAHSSGGLQALRQRETQWQERGAPVNLLPREEAAAQIGSNAFLGALLDRRAGTVQPLAYAIGLARAAVDAGAALYKNSPVTGFERRSGRWRLDAPAGSVHAKAVVVATHGYPVEAFSQHSKNLIPFNYFQFATAPLANDVLKTVLPGKNGAWDTALILSSYRLDQAGRLIIGSVGQVSGMAYGLHRQWVQRTIARVFPQVGEVALEYGWHGRIAMTTNHMPRFHILDTDMVMVTSYNGRGIGPGTVFGKLLAEYVLDGKAENIPLPVVQPSRVFMRGLRGLFYETGARLYHFVQRRI